VRTGHAAGLALGLVGTLTARERQELGLLAADPDGTFVPGRGGRDSTRMSTFG
jgi:hypothetical protein